MDNYKLLQIATLQMQMIYNGFINRIDFITYDLLSSFLYNSHL